MYDPDSGVMRWRVSPSKNVRAGDLAGYERSGYLVVRFNGVTYKVHRLAWLYVHGCSAVGHVDHINGNKLDNRISNLRDVSRSFNAQNQRRAHTNNRSGLLGVTIVPGSKGGPVKFAAHISINGRKRHLGRFDSADQAHAAYVAAKRQHHAGNTL